MQEITKEVVHAERILSEKPAMLSQWWYSPSLRGRNNALLYSVPDKIDDADKLVHHELEETKNVCVCIPVLDFPHLCSVLLGC